MLKLLCNYYNNDDDDDDDDDYDYDDYDDDMECIYLHLKFLNLYNFHRFSQHTVVISQNFTHNPL